MYLRAFERGRTSNTGAGAHEGGEEMNEQTNENESKKTIRQSERGLGAKGEEITEMEIKVVKILLQMMDVSLLPPAYA